MARTKGILGQAGPLMHRPDPVPVPHLLLAAGAHRSAVLLGLKLFGMIGAIGGHAIAETATRVAMLDRVRQQLDASWREVLPWRQLSVIGLASLVACAPAMVITRLAAGGPRPFAALCAAGALYAATYLLVIAMMPGEGSALARVRRILLGHTTTAAA